MSELSNRQKRYLLLQKRHHLIVNLSRLLILILFLGLWEITSRLGMIDSFVFSSPAKIVRCFWSMVLDRSIFLHLGITLYETILSFLFVTGISILRLQHDGQRRKCTVLCRSSCMEGNQ